MAVLQTSDVMFLCVFLLCAGLHFTTGCTEAARIISCSPGESVLLHCRDKNSQHKHVQWQRTDIQKKQNPVNVIKDQRYKDRVQIHGNLSLSITRLTVDDAGSYWCNFTEPVHLIIEGCSLSGNGASVSISRYSGESVFLSCLVKCSARYNPDKIRWKLPNNREINQTTNSTELSPLYQGRFHMFSKNTGNFSLLISNLTEKYEGLYSCWINENQHKSFSLTVKGCVLSEHPNTIISYPGESVTLPCSCEDPKTKPKHIEWKRAAVNETLVSDSKDVSGRFQILRDSPHNLSLRISNLTETDGGLYVCTVNGKQSRSINLTVTDLSKNYLKYSLIFPICLMLLLLTGFICWRFTRANKGRSRVTQRPDHQDDMTYSSVMLINSEKPAKNQQQDDDTYSSVVYCTFTNQDLYR